MINFLFKNKVLRFIFSGGTSFFVHISILYLLVNYFNLWYLSSTMIAFCFAVLVNFSLQKFFTFKDYSKKDMHFKFLKFFIFAFIMLCMNTLLMFLFVGILGFWYIFGQIFVNLCTAIVSFFFFNSFLFKR